MQFINTDPEQRSTVGWTEKEPCHTGWGGKARLEQSMGLAHSILSEPDFILFVKFDLLKINWTENQQANLNKRWGRRCNKKSNLSHKEVLFILVWSDIHYKERNQHKVAFFSLSFLLIMLQFSGIAEGKIYWLFKITKICLGRPFCYVDGQILKYSFLYHL